MKFKNLLLRLSFLSLIIPQAIPQHVSDRSIYATDIKDADGDLVFKFPTLAPSSSRAMVTNANGQATTSSVTDTELGFLSGVTSNVQTQLNGKQASGTYVNSVGASSPLLSSGGVTPSISCQTASGSQAGCLSSSDWSLFNSKYSGLPNQSGNSGKFLTTNGTSESWATISTTPPGSDTQLIFNDGGAYGADPNFVWNKVNDALGVQVTPLNPLHVAAISGTTINNVTVGSVSQTAEVAAPSVTGSATAIAEFSAPANVSANRNTSGSGYSASGQTIDYQIYGLIYNGSAYYKSSNFGTVSFTDTLNDASSFSVNVSWDAIAGATHYLIEKQVNGGGFNDSAIVSANSFEDTSFSGSESTNTWPTEYTLATGPTSFTGGSAQYINQGFGSIFEFSTTILMEVDSVKNIYGTDYVSGTPTSGSFDDTGTGQYDAEINWTDNGNATNGIARISTDGGSTWNYQFTGSTTGPYTFTGISNDSAAEAIWLAGAFAGSTNYTFDVYGKGLTPSSQIYYSSTPNTYNVTISSPGNYIFKHTFSGMGAQGAKILYPSGAATVGQDVSGDFYDIGNSTWASGLTVTPNSYGYSGTNQVREYKIYSLATIYGNTPLTISTSNTGGSKYNTLTWTLPSGVTQVKITRGINGGAHTVSKTVTGTTTTDDSTDNGWSGNTTVTPTSTVPGSARIDRATTSLTDVALFKPHLELVNTHTSGDRSAVLSFGVASGSGGNSTFQSHIYHSSSTSHLNAATTRFRLVNSLGASTFTTQLGDTNEFNMLNGSSNHFTIRSQSNNTLFTTRSDRDTAYIGYSNSAPGVDNTASLDLGRRVGSDHNLYIDVGSTSNSGDAIKLAASGSFIGAWGANGNLGLRRSIAPTNSTLQLGAVSGQTQILFDSHSGGAQVAGGMYYDGNSHVANKSNAIKTVLGGNLTQFQSDAGNSGTSATDAYSYTIPTNTLDADGMGISANYGGTFVNSASTKKVEVMLDGTVIYDSTAMTPSATGSWALDVKCNRVSSTVARCIVGADIHGTASYTHANYTSVTVANWTSTRILKLRLTAAGGGAASNDIVARLGRVRFEGKN